MSRRNVVDTLIVDATLLDVRIYQMEKDKCMTARPLALAVIDPYTSNVLAIYCAIGKVAQHLLELSQNISIQVERIVDIVDFNEDEGIWKLCENRVNGKMENCWIKVTKSFEAELEKGVPIPMDLFLQKLSKYMKEEV